MRRARRCSFLCMPLHPRRIRSPLPSRTRSRGRAQPAQEESRRRCSASSRPAALSPSLLLDFLATNATPVLLRVTTMTPFAWTEPQPRPLDMTPPRTTTGSLSNPSNPQNATLGEQGPFPHPFPTKHGLPLARIQPSSPLVAPGTTLQRSRSF
jgi:hypothetical protein